MATITKSKWFWAWQDEKEETWLREMSNQGWHLVAAQPFGKYIFASGEAKDYVYRLDYMTPTQKDLDGYLKLFEDAGWEYIGDMMGWKYFRKLAREGENPEIYTDNQSKIQKYQRLLGYLVIFGPVWFILMTSVFDRESSGLFTFMTLIKLLSAAILIIYVFAFLKIFWRIRELRQNSL